MTNTALRGARRSKKRNDPVHTIHTSGINPVAADDDDDFEPPIQPMITNQPRNLNVKKKQKKITSPR
ncbi:hypothetical protein HanXRQr2_Chr16g0738311 [Helianthus annuus]|uniref:Uncharacterized protein n=1 Tax=Helianthus annuus TaxID=4232 RepID=A0A9K3GXH3_HELAN|nr:hypothetical protein HanXRQr2_Chr16g0738311 [Helianthus annuus]KAJ0437425.1 hypothetical protein HanHA300_Chr16g0602021 [Helianthus annuus]KAJ0459744.1 hypothetical protein HanHA89_Chr16g0652551 [Helianthus annuus]